MGAKELRFVGKSIQVLQLRHVDAASTYDALNRTPVSTLLTLNATCDGTIRDEWPRYLGLDSPTTVVMPWTDWIVSHAPQEFWAQVSEKGRQVLVHTTCRGKVAQGEGAMEQLAALTSAIPVPLGIACCGAAGSYAFKAEHEDVAAALGKSAKSALEELCLTPEPESMLKQSTNNPISRFGTLWCSERKIRFFFG